jgi:hypothetical protein
VRRLIIAIIMFMGGSAFAYHVSIDPVGGYRIQINGELADDHYDDYTTALESALTISLNCADCVVLIAPPSISVSTTGDVTPPPVVIPPPVIPPVVPTDPTVFYSFDLDDHGGLVDPAPLDGATVPPEVFNIEVYGGHYETLQFWCCESESFDRIWNSVINTGGMRGRIDASMYAGSTETHLLYADLYVEGGQSFWGLEAFFQIANAVNPIPPPVVELPIEGGDTIVMTWNAPTERVDGPELNGISGYIVEIDNGHDDPLLFPANTTEFTIQKSVLGVGTWNFRVQAIDMTPSTICPPEIEAAAANPITNMPQSEINRLSDLAYTCGGPLTSAFSNAVMVVID